MAIISVWPAAAIAFFITTERGLSDGNKCAPAATEPDDTKITSIPRARQRTMNCAMVNM